jgi:four helix bundle protein
LCRELPNNRESWRIGDQLFRCGTSVGANYRSACRGRSRAEFIAKLGIALEEVDESVYWMEMIDECAILPSDRVAELMNEAKQLTAIFIASLNTAKKE